MSPFPMATPSSEPPPAALGPLLVMLSILTALAAITKVVGLSAPLPQDDAPSSVRLAGYSISALASRPAQQRRELSRGMERRFRLVPRTGEPVLTLSLVPVRTRTGTNYSTETLGGQGLSLDTVRGVIPDFAIHAIRIALLPGTTEFSPLRLDDQVAFGRRDRDAAGDTTRLQTCITPSGIAAVNADRLAMEGRARQQRGLTPDSFSRLLRVAGLSPARHECLAVQLELADVPSLPPRDAGTALQRLRLEAAWRRLRGVLPHGKDSER